MFGIARLAIAATLLATPAVGVHAAGFGTVPQTELSAFCHKYGGGRHLATFFMDDGLRLMGHVNCDRVTFTLNAIRPPLDEEVLAQ